MNGVLLLHFAQTYLTIKKRGAIWVEGPNGCHSDYKEPTKKFLLRFDSPVQKQILAVVRRLDTSLAHKRTLQEIIDNA